MEDAAAGKYIPDQKRVRMFLVNRVQASSVYCKQSRLYECNLLWRILLRLHGDERPVHGPDTPECFHPLGLKLFPICFARVGRDALGRIELLNKRPDPIA